MSREIRKVPANWQHPKDERGHYIPLREKFPYIQEEIEEGLSEGWLTNEPPHYGIPVMPEWTAEEKTHIQMYEDTSEGTPISPVMDTPENLARWLTDNGASVFADDIATYDQWLYLCNGGWAPAMVMQGGKVMSGIEAVHPANTES